MIWRYIDIGNNRTSYNHTCQKRIRNSIDKPVKATCDCTMVTDTRH